jgi:hypothetical protein
MTVACVRGAGGTAAESRPAVTRFSLDDHVYVLLWTDAQLYRSRDDRNPVRAYDFGGVSRQERAGEVFLARLVEDHGAWLKVVTGPLTWWDNGRGRSLHCAGTGVVDSAWGLELWIRAQDTAPVLAERLSRSYPDGTSVDLDPGTPIVEGHPWVDGFLLPLEVPAAQVGTRYTPSHHAAPPSDEEFSLHRLTTMNALLGGRAAPWKQPAWDHSAPPFVRLDKSKDLLHRSNGCGTIKLAFQGSAERDDAVGTLGVLRASGKGVPGVEVAAGTALTWADRSPPGPAGTTLEVVRKAGEPNGEQVCFDVRVGLEWRAPGYQSAHLKVCTAASAGKPVMISEH